MNNILKVLFLGIMILFLTLYLTTLSNYQEIQNKKQNILTEEALKRFEQDVAAGKEIIASNYLTNQKEYNNKISSLGLKLSNFIENTYKKIIYKIFKNINNMIQE